MAQRQVFLTGATGFIGSATAAELLRRGHAVRALVRPGSANKLPRGCEAVAGNALESDGYAARIALSDTFVHLVGVSHPSPSKAAEFQSIDLQSIRQAVKAASQAGIRHFVYLSVARPAPIMREYQAVRAEGERLITDAFPSATFIRPWYVLGPGRRWPLVLVPLYALARLIPATRDPAERLALVTREQMVETLVWSIENPASGIRVLQPNEIRAGGTARAEHHAKTARLP
jgi:nucleoside-diphosphate-sugar epimerase